ncbi:MAG: class I tRNA ligase family protein, partial [Candidatus Pacebacteria bacterium]|nr:class I tRNA ligase family protein [Candidatus Paceibacterota bacterium]
MAYFGFLQKSATIGDMGKKVESIKKKVESDGRTKSETALREEEVLAFWKERGIFEKSLTKNAPEGEFVFYDGPPFATGLPHWGSLLSSISKDVFGRYKTMRGYRVPRRWGWDCHGLPIENMIEKKLDLKSKKDIEAMGIDRFNEEARATVLQYADDWKKYVDRVGRWVDFDHSYKTMDNSYIESVWWALKKIHGDGRLYEGRKVLMFCPHCETPLSKAEIAMDNSYKDVTDTAVYVKFRVTSAEEQVPSAEERVESNEGRVMSHESRGASNELRVTSDEKRGASDGIADDSVRVRRGIPNDGKPIYILAWTTTPWTLPANVALAVGPKMTYVLVEQGDERFILAKERLLVLGAGVTVMREFLGEELVGTTYEPLYVVEKTAVAESEKAWTVLSADFVTTEDGTGVVHIAPMYGEDDYALGVLHDLPVVPLLDATGTYNADAPELVRGMFYKKGGKYVLEDLKTRGLFFAEHDHFHSYPHCHRCGTALIYNALTSWFINIQKVKEKLLSANEGVNWYPEHLKHGRFQNIVESAPDWTISRNRFWASPLPIWKHEKTGEVAVLGSLAELRERTKRSGNTYLFLRHGEAQSNVDRIVSSLPENPHHLTEKGKEQSRLVAEGLHKRGITKIITSPLVRTRETAEIIADEMGYGRASIEIEDRFKEWQQGVLNNQSLDEHLAFYTEYVDRFLKTPEKGETLVEMKHRVGEALYALEEKYQNETILIVAHEYTAWLAECVAQGADTAKCIEIRGTAEDFIQNGEVRELDFVSLPHNKEYELDLHRPYIDDLPLVAEDGARMIRIPEVVDCWVESGSMPFASEHYPHENKELVKRRYPGDFIAEYIAQTRTWFYYMHALGVLLFDAPSFKNCLTTGTLLAADGAKISKSKKNYTDPLLDMDKYGADAGRFYVMGSVVMTAEDVAFKEEELREAHNRFIGMLWNSYKFYEMQNGGGTNTEHRGATIHVLDRWILARLSQVTQEVTDYMDAYDTVRTARALREFVSDLSTWYIRRSRDRFKGEDVEDREQVQTTTAHVFQTFATLIAPITPYIAEDVYRGAGGTAESVHLATWPDTLVLQEEEKQLLVDMAEVRRIASLILEARQKVGIKVRQPLA